MILPVVLITRCCEEGCRRPAVYFIDPATGRKPRVVLSKKLHFRVSAGWCRLHYEMLAAIAVRNDTLADEGDHLKLTRGVVG